MTSKEWHETVDHTICVGDQKIVEQILSDLDACEHERDEWKIEAWFWEGRQDAESARVKELERCIESWKREELLWDGREKALVERVKVLEEACHAYVDLCACYRLGKRPSEKLFGRLDKARAALRKEGA